MNTQEISYRLILDTVTLCTVFITPYRGTIVKNRTYMCVIDFSVSFESYIFQVFQF